MDVRHDSRVELFRAVPIAEIAETRELQVKGASFLAEVFYLIYASSGPR